MSGAKRVCYCLLFRDYHWREVGTGVKAEVFGGREAARCSSPAKKWASTITSQLPTLNKLQLGKGEEACLGRAEVKN